ncbi:MAG: extracellular solute-binding protein [Acholeplasmatales bacterium]|nr:MAG: extracellular solute-binding protein [Acholeplasmatales bacterium]
MTAIWMKKGFLIGLLSACIIIVFLVVSGTFSATTTARPKPADITPVALSNRYSEYLMHHQDALTPSDAAYVIPAAAFSLATDETLSEDASYYHWENPVSIRVTVDVQTRGLYSVVIEYVSHTTSHIPISLAMTLNDEADAPFHEASHMTLDTLWQDAEDIPSQDRYGNDVSLLQLPFDRWQVVPLRDARRLYPEGLTFYLEAGENTLELEKLTGALSVRAITVQAKPVLTSYADYRHAYDDTASPHLVRLEAENTLFKNSSTITRGVSTDARVLPFSMSKLRLNVLGTDSFDAPGDAVTWVVDVPTPGYYHVTFKVKQTRQNTTAYRTLYVNGEIPFKEAKHLVFPYERNWQNAPLQSFSQEPFLIYLAPGDEITLAVDPSMFTAVVERLQVLTAEMSRLGLDVTKITRNVTDRGIDWPMIEFFPDLPETLDRWQSEIDAIADYLRSVYGFERDAHILQDIKAAGARLEKIAADIDELPRRLTLLSMGSSSAVQLLANQIDAVLHQPMIIDAFYVHTEEQVLPDANASFLQKVRVFFTRFFYSFFDPSYQETADADELEIWVNRSRQYVDMMQKMVDDQFTTQTGIRVKVSLLADDGKLLLANSADQQPDIALGVSAWIPNEYGMRGMLYDMSQAKDFEQTIQVYHPEQLVPMVFDEKLYGLPETQNFYLLFYRRDILDELGLDVPDTWDDVLGMLPVLNRFGMSFFIPLSSASAAKSFDSTAPFIFQFGGKIYSDDGMTAAIDDENTVRAMQFMTDLYREYSLPFQVPSFFNSFRYATIPIGIGDFGLYLQLTNAASEISGLWDIAVVPGMPREQVNPDTGELETIIDRSMPGAQQAGIIFEKSDKLDEAWQFMSWWMSTEIQVHFAETMVNTLGSRYLWNSANKEAFEQFSWDEDHKAVILEQWTHVKEVPKVPGSYIIERELSNTWNSVVHADANLRSTMSDALIKMNRELARKMLEFGFLDNRGNVIRTFEPTTAEIVKRWYPDA